MTSRGPEYFERIYAGNPDPWDFNGSIYEQEKYRATLETLQGRQFRSCFEIGCSIGVFTKMLAPYCNVLLAADIVQSALDAAQERCAGLTHVSFQNIQVPENWPKGMAFDLIVISEVLYFLDTGDIAALTELCGLAVMPGGLSLLVNYTGEIDEPCGGDEAAEAFIASAVYFKRIKHVRRERFRIDLLQRCEGG